VYLFEPDRTQFDLSWRMFGISVRVQPMFWAMAAVTGWGFLHAGFEYLFAWIACVFVSVLIHELGHVYMGRLFGSHGHIILYGFGGLAVGSSALRSRAQRIAVSFAGPLAGFVYLGLVILAVRALRPDEFPVMMEVTKWRLGLQVDEMLMPGRISLTQHIFASLFFINLFWGLMNLLPIWPLDGGQISRDFFGGLDRRNGEQIALGISVVVSGLIALQGVSIAMGGPALPFLRNLDGVYLALMFGLLAVASFQALQQAQHRPWRTEWPDDRWDREDEHWPRR
jgi:Zn-dependent protease